MYCIAYCDRPTCRITFLHEHDGLEEAISWKLGIQSINWGMQNLSGLWYFFPIKKIKINKNTQLPDTVPLHLHFIFAVTVRYKDWEKKKLDEKAASLRMTFRRSGELFDQLTWKCGSLTERKWFITQSVMYPKWKLYQPLVWDGWAYAEVSF